MRRFLVACVLGLPLAHAGARATHTGTAAPSEGYSSSSRGMKKSMCAISVAMARVVTLGLAFAPLAPGE